MDPIREGVLLRSARNAAGQNDLPLALQRFDELFREFPQPENIRFEWVGLLISAGKLDEAEKELTTLTRSDPTNMVYQSQYSDLLLQRGKHELAERSLRELLNNGAASIEAIATLARVLAWQGRKQEAIELYNQRLLNIGRVPIEADMRIARLLMEVDGPREGVQIIHRLLEQQQTHPELGIDLVLALTRIGAQAETHPAMAMLFENPFVLPNHRMGLADTLYLEGHLSTTSSNRLVRLETANFDTAISEHATAFAIYQSLLALDANYADAVKGFGVLMHAIGDYPRAESYLRRGLRITSTDKEMRQMLAKVLMKQKRVNEAAEVLMESKSGVAARIDHPPPDAAPMIADLLYRSGEYVTAENVAKSSLRAHRDWCGWASAHFAASAITSDVYTGIGVSGLVTLRMQ